MPGDRERERLLGDIPAQRRADDEDVRKVEDEIREKQRRASKEDVQKIEEEADKPAGQAQDD